MKKFKILEKEGLKYSKVSGDKNKIHIDELTGYNSIFISDCNLLQFKDELRGLRAFWFKDEDSSIVSNPKTRNSGLVSQVNYQAFSKYQNTNINKTEAPSYRTIFLEEP